jgi:hypothetical protein
LRKIQAGLARGGYVHVRVEVPGEVATYLLNQKRAELLRMEKQYRLKVQIVGQTGMPRQQYNLEFSHREAPPQLEKAPGEMTDSPPPEAERVSPEDADIQAIEELKNETKESLLKRLFWPSSFWRSQKKK